MELIGNQGITTQLSLMSQASAYSDRPLPHMLLSGSPGCGKTSTAKYISSKMGSRFFSVVPEAIKTRDDVLRIIEMFDRKTGYDREGNRLKDIRISYPILFIDEIHRMPITGQEHLGIVMEEWQIPIEQKRMRVGIYDKLNLRTDRYRWCPLFTLIGATTNDGLLSKPFKDRFKAKFIFSTYTLEESIKIVLVHNDRLNAANTFTKVNIDHGGAMEIAKRGRGTPRILVTLLERCRDLALAKKIDTITTEVSIAMFAILNIDGCGLTETDIKILKLLFNSNDPIGLDNLAVITNESKQAISDTVEPYLIQQELISRTGRGRALTDKGKEYLVSNGHIEDKQDYVDIPYNYNRRL